MKFKASLLCSLVAFSASTLAADDTKTYVVQLSTDIASEVSVQLVDGSGNELATSQTQPLVRYTSGEGHVYLRAQRLVDGYKLASNDPGVTFDVTRTLSPLTIPSGTDVDVYASNIRAVSDSCTENFESSALTASTMLNQEVKLRSTMTNDDSLCPTDVKFQFRKPNITLPAGQYAATLTIDVAPSL
ncbi:hypothetical protein [Vibrio alginolyticus]|uniref:hypothetical protein n=1 Tax=Vibrio alginolyticus TaxID=663 RepID=UPI00255324D8|nr:hypothetical protein [Vibrio alginolyticus]MDL0445808.1 hypothetical protein [Vibrio alginolyticus]